MIPKIFDPALTPSQAEAQIVQINRELTAAQQALIKRHGSWAKAQLVRDDMKDYNGLLADRRKLRKLLNDMLRVPHGKEE